MIDQRSPTFLASGTSFVEDNFSTNGGGCRGGGGEGSGSNVSDGERWGAAEETSLAHPPLTTCCAAGFLTGHGRGVGDPCDR